MSPIPFCTLGILLFAFVISASVTIGQMVRLYQLQAGLVAVIALLMAINTQSLNTPVVIVASLPILLALLIPLFLGRATLAQAGETAENKEPLEIPEWGARLRAFLTDLGQSPRKAALTWLQHGQTCLAPILSVGVDLFLTIFAFVVAISLSKPTMQEDPTNSVVSVAVPLALMLMGIFITINRRDIIAQIIGLLVMEHGLYLATVRILDIPDLALIFAFSLVFYIFITLAIFVWLLPELHRTSSTIELNEQQQLKG